MILITHIRLQGGRGHESIVRLRWQNPSTGQMNQSSTACSVNCIDRDRGDARVRDARSGREAFVGVVRPAVGPPFLRTQADGLPNDNLGALPAF